MPEESVPSSDEKCVLTKAGGPVPKRSGGQIIKLSNDLSFMSFSLFFFRSFITTFLHLFFLYFVIIIIIITLIKLQLV